MLKRSVCLRKEPLASGVVRGEALGSSGFFRIPGKG